MSDTSGAGAGAGRSPARTPPVSASSTEAQLAALKSEVRLWEELFPTNPDVIRWAAWRGGWTAPRTSPPPPPPPAAGPALPTKEFKLTFQFHCWVRTTTFGFDISNHKLIIRRNPRGLQTQYITIFSPANILDGVGRGFKGQ